MMRQRAQKDDHQSIDISPLIDMVFILLIFFMVSTTFVQDMNLDIDRPSAKSAESASSESIRLYIASNGDTYLDGEPVRTWMIQNRLRELLSTSTSKSVLVVVDDSVTSKRLVEVVDQARLAGGEVGVATQEEAGGRRAAS